LQLLHFDGQVKTAYTGWRL
jgi:hypothetical protein